MKMLVIVCVMCLSMSCAHNRLNRHKQRKGKWIAYTDSTKAKKLFEGRFRNGQSVGRAYYYNLDGVLERREISRFGKLKTTLYYSNGKKSLQGQARIEDLPDKVHYYFYGRWNYYDEQGRLIKHGYFEKGKLVRNEYLVNPERRSDTLAQYLQNLGQAFADKHAGLINTINLNDPQNSEPYRLQLCYRDSLTFERIGRFLLDHGYPDTTFSAEAANVPFFVLSYGTIAVREKYLALLKIAAGSGSLSWNTLSFYIDKLQLAKGGKQIYGTQYYIKGFNLVYYPIADPDNLEKRRAEIGLEESK